MKLNAGCTENRQNKQCVEHLHFENKLETFQTERI